MQATKQAAFNVLCRLPDKKQANVTIIKRVRMIPNSGRCVCSLGGTGNERRLRLDTADTGSQRPHLALVPVSDSHRSILLG